MAATKYRFSWNGTTTNKLLNNLPNGVNAAIDGISPLMYVDISLDPGVPGSPAEEDLLDFMVNNGWIFIESNPVTPLPSLSKCCRIYHNVNQVCATVPGSLVVAFNSERFDNDNMHNNAVNNSRITFNTPGKYQVTANVSWDINNNGSRAIYIRHNGVTILAGDVRPSATLGGFVDCAMCVTTLYEFNAGDYVELLVSQDSGGDLNLNSNAKFSPEFQAVGIIG